MHPVTLVVVAIVVVALVVTFWLDSRRVPAVRAAWGQWPDDARDLAAIARYAHRREASAGETPDERTWTDLNMDDVFRLLDRAESLVGQQVLYRRLRRTPQDARLASFEQLVRRFETDADARAHAQRALRRLRKTDAAAIAWLIEPSSFDSPAWHVVFPLLAVTVVTAAVLSFFSPVWLFLVAVCAIAAIGFRVTAAGHLQVAGGAFRHVEPIITAATSLQTLVDPETASLIGDCRAVPELAGLRRVARWVGRDSSGAASGELSETVREYLNVLLALDGNAVYFGSRLLHAHGPLLVRVAESVGEIDAALSIASFRTGTPGWTRPVTVEPGQPVVIDDLRHPLVPDAVPASLRLAPPNGIIITGANMSGKTTFLRAVGVNFVLAQTVNTCTAVHFHAPVFAVRSCIGRADDPSTGKSYYLVEVEAVLSLVAASQGSTPHLFLFDELFRGTNTVERIAAGEAVLAQLLPEGTSSGHHLVIAATHDLELVDLLRPHYAPFHFADRVDATGLAFDYQLRPGPATTRNAIALLRQKGAPAELLSRATKRADVLDEARRGSPVG